MRAYISLGRVKVGCHFESFIFQRDASQPAARAACTQDPPITATQLDETPNDVATGAS